MRVPEDRTAGVLSTALVPRHQRHAEDQPPLPPTSRHRPGSAGGPAKYPDRADGHFSKTLTEPAATSTNPLQMPQSRWRVVKP